MKVAVVVFPGSNCDADVAHAVEVTIGASVEMVWHASESLPAGTDLVILPGGFSYGDYLRCGAMAARSSIMKGVKRFASSGGLVLGICNGFQILTEAKMLRGVFLPNRTLSFICRPCTLRVERDDTPFTLRYKIGQVVHFPIAHHEGLYYLDKDELDALEKRRQVVFRYATPTGEATDEANPNGALNNIAGMVNEGGNVLGLIPHPERASEPVLGSVDGALMWQSISEWIKGGGAH
ncbi:phosphoribosylformylglycinamidine synthase subunit PurQ [Acetomicrobium sp. S15 = DSM 107314]|uniref:phosphoribosylformylglycinamidine synthase subunit PurQ n=1 Tax=Acetomicrobium sp. S15 = DSM 107314 TaxID=2529858 RepID=UPI0018E15C5B|nr:phosphoribosylformylglycinamidine synthase subunit PurQ [Acetomicrobium sp. S15 = DSM 107314]